MERKHRIYHSGAGFFAWLLGSVLHYRDKEVMINLSRSFPDKKYKELKQIHKQFYRHFGEIIAEALWFGRNCRGNRGCKRLHRSHIVEMTNPEVLNRMFRENLQVMAMESHTGNWELIGGFFNYNYSDEPLAMSPEHIAVTYNRLHSARWDRFMAKNRCAPLTQTKFAGYCESREILRYAVQHRRDPHVYVFITDQYPYKFATKHHLGQFMHQDTETMNGAAVLACKMNMAVVYLRFVRREGGGYALTFIPIAEHAGESTPEAIMEKYYTLLEEDINAQPWNYLWSHKRWK